MRESSSRNPQGYPQETQMAVEMSADLFSQRAPFFVLNRLAHPVADL
jgi:hypothetical protein